MPSHVHTHHRTTSTDDQQIVLSEEYVQEAFHSFLKSSLTQAKVEGLLDNDILSSAEGDLMITGPALCLYFAALRSTTSPPSVPLPRKTKASAPIDLSEESCPVSFRSFWTVWSTSVPEIQALPPEHQHDLARIICGLPPIAQPPIPRIKGIAADLRAVAIEISMRRTFQERYASDLQAALDRTSGGSVKASFKPPPGYDAGAPQTPPPRPHPHITTSESALRPPRPESMLSPMPPDSVRAPSPTILSPAGPAIELIRETLYAALADVLERMPQLRRMLQRDATRAYFAAVAFAVLDVATGSATHPDTHRDVLAEVFPEERGKKDEMAIRGVLGQTLTLSQCPVALQPFMKELCEIGKMATEMEEEDSMATVEALQRGDEPPVPRLDRVKDIIERGVGGTRRRSDPSDDHGSSTNGANGHHGSRREARRRTTSTENRAVAFANRINALALGMTKLPAFKERQEMVFKVLAGIGG